MTAKRRERTTTDERVSEPPAKHSLTDGGKSVTTGQATLLGFPRMPQFDDPVVSAEGPSEPDLIELYRYWDRLRGDRRMPSRSEIDPTEAPRGILPRLMLVDVLGTPRRYRFRLMGTWVTEASGGDLTGRYFDDSRFAKKSPILINQYDAVADSGKPLYSVEPFENPVTKVTLPVGRLLLPLSTDGNRVDAILVGFSFRRSLFRR
jgi:hypothetical protein